jgi:hypothetical protein
MIACTLAALVSVVVVVSIVNSTAAPSPAAPTPVDVTFAPSVSTLATAFVVAVVETAWSMVAGAVVPMPTLPVAKMRILSLSPLV